MDFKFDPLISQSIKRLTRPKFNNEFPNFYDHKAYNNYQDGIDAELMEIVEDQETLSRLMNACDVNYDDVPASAAINFNPVFGKICQGETFIVLFVIQNSSPSFNVDQLEIKINVESGGQKDANGAPINLKEHKVIKKSIPQLGPREQLGFVISFRVENLDNYQMQIDCNYSSKQFTEQLNKFMENNEDIEPYQINSSHATIDFVRRKVTRHQTKKYKFDAQRPFEVSKNITVRNN